MSIRNGASYQIGCEKSTGKVMILVEKWERVENLEQAFDIGG